jgi:NitT/TauT family transport system permease protein
MSQIFDFGRIGSRADPDDAPPSLAMRLLASRSGLLVARIGVILLIFVLWQLMSDTLIPAFWISKPSEIFALLGQWLLDGTIWHHAKATLLAMAIGYAMGCAGGVGAGFLLGWFPRVDAVVQPFIVALYSLPKIALAPLLIIVFGIGISSKIALVCVTVGFLVLFNTLSGLRSVDHDVVDALQIMGVDRREIALKVLVPTALPWIFTGMRIAVRYALTATVLGELIAANEGLGYLIDAKAGEFDATGVFAAIILLVVCSVTVTEILTWLESSTSGPQH